MAPSQSAELTYSSSRPPNSMVLRSSSSGGNAEAVHKFLGSTGSSPASHSVLFPILLRRRCAKDGAVRHRTANQRA